MALEIQQQLRLSQQLVMTPQLQQAIKMLQLSRLELLDSIHQEMEANPALEEAGIDDTELSASVYESSPLEQPMADGDAPVPEVVTEGDRVMDQIDWRDYTDEYSSNYPSYSFEEKEATSYESNIATRPSLSTHLMWQLIMSHCTEQEKEIGNLIIGNLNSDGYLKASISEIAALADASEEFVLEVLQEIQEFDPVGVAARDVRECLLIQVRHLNLAGSLVETIVSKYLHYLEIKNYQAISKEMGISLEDVWNAVEIIMRLEPRPGRAYGGEEAHYISPDIYVHKMGDEYVISLNEDSLPRLRVSSFYKDILSRSPNVTNPVKDYVQTKLRSAIWLIRSIHQRQRTIYRVTESIVKYQRDFLDKGISYLRPLILKDIAEDVEMHESTVSRVTTNKYVHTPQGLFELKFFFNTGISRGYGEAIASEAVRDKIRRIIQVENPLRPYSDKEIVGLLKNDNIDIARRTVAKYREVIGILPSSQRKKPRMR